MRRAAPLGLLILMLAMAPLAAQTGAAITAEDPRHDELRALRRQLVDASNSGDFGALLPLLEDNVVVTWMNGEVSRGPAGVRAYIERMTKGPDRIVERFSTDPEADDLTHLMGDSGYAWGSSRDHFVLTDGRDLVVPTRWSALLVRRDGRWRIAAFHASTNVFDNPVLGEVKRWVVRAGVGGLVLGMVAGGLIAWLLLRSRRRAAAPAVTAPPVA